MIDVERIIAEVAGRRDISPELDERALALATADKESHFDPQAVGDRGTDFPAYGVFQERVKVGRGGFDVPDPDPARQTSRFLDDVASFIAGGGSGTPGDIAAAVQRPADPSSYAEDVNRRYNTYLGLDPVPAVDKCPPGLVLRNGVCVSPFDPGLATGPGIGEPFQQPGDEQKRANLNPLDGIPQAIETFRQGAAQLAIAAAVIGVGGILIYLGVRRTLGV